MAAPKKFTAAKRQPTAPIPFDIEYERHVPIPDAELPEVRIEVASFQALPKGAVPAGILLDWAAAMNDEGQVPIGAVQQFLSGTLVAEDVTRFERLSRDKQVALNVEVLVSIIQWLNEEYGDRPTVPSSSSGDGSASAGDGPTAAGPATPLVPAPAPVPS